MSAKPFAIVTATDEHCGDFVCAHWFPSIADNVDLTMIDVVVLDYGLSEEQRELLQRGGVRVVPCPKDGFVANLRLRNIVELLDTTPYRRLLLSDSGDVIFQADVSHLLSDGENKLAVVTEESRTPFYEIMIDYGDVRPEHEEIVGYDVERPILNIGLVCATAESFREIWREYQMFCHGLQCYGSDQLVFNYFAYHRGFRSLDPRYNFVPLTTRRRFEIRRGVFYDDAGRVIPIVHNAGGRSFFRVINRFGYGPDRNRPRRFRATMLHLAIAWINAWSAAKRWFGRPMPSKARSPHLANK